MFRKFLIWLNGGGLDSHTEPPSRLDLLDGVGATWREGLVEPSDAPWDWPKF